MDLKALVANTELHGTILASARTQQTSIGGMDGNRIPGVYCQGIPFASANKSYVDGAVLHTVTVCTMVWKSHLVLVQTTSPIVTLALFSPLFFSHV